MTTEILYQQSQILIAIVLLALMIIFGELGYRIGRKRRSTNNEPTRDQTLGIQASLIGLLALLLGFTFAMALSRLEIRKQMVVKESNAIGTAALRANFLPNSYSVEVRNLFKRYVRIRLESVLNTAQSSSERDKYDIEATQIQRQLWQIAYENANIDQRSVSLGLFVDAINRLIDIKTERDIAVANHVPESVLLLLLGFSVLIALIIGYGNGLVGAPRITIPTAISIVIIVLVILVIIDLDRPQTGLIRISQKSMTQLENILNVSH